MKTVYMAWQAHDASRAWFPIGRLDFDNEIDQYAFTYTQGASHAQACGFTPLVAFPNLDQTYKSAELFSLFKNRILRENRPEFKDFLRSLAIPGNSPTPIEVLAASGGERKTDSLQIFPKIELALDRSFSTRFFIHGSRYLSNDSQTRLDTLVQNEPLRLCLETANPAGGNALQLQSQDYKVLGWCPRFLVDDLTKALLDEICPFEVKVLQHNSVQTPTERRVLVELSGCFPEHFSPMQSDVYKPYVEMKTK
jgi:hypothetical protein